MIAAPTCSVGRPNRGPSSPRAEARADRGAERPRDERHAGVRPGRSRARAAGRARTTSISPIIPAKNTSAHASPALKARLRNRLIVTSGETPARSRRRSTATKRRARRSAAAIDDERPRGPAGLAALDQRVDEQAGGDA